MKYFEMVTVKKVPLTSLIYGLITVWPLFKTTGCSTSLKFIVLISDGNQHTRIPLLSKAYQGQYLNIENPLWQKWFKFPETFVNNKKKHVVL